MLNTTKTTLRLIFFVLLNLGVTTSCSKSEEQVAANKSAKQEAASIMDKASMKGSDNSVAWAVNFGGKAYLGNDGISYQRDDLPLKAETGVIEQIKGAQDSHIYHSYREGDIQLSKALENGVYDILFKFAEPADIAVGSRVFNVFAQSKKVIDTLDIRLARDGKHHSALVRTVTGVQVTNGMLDIHFDAIKGEPVLNAIVVQKKHIKSRDWQLVWQDEFDVDGTPDQSKWNFDVWPARKVNDEDQAYTARAKNVRVKDGKLIIEAHKESYNNAEYTSARLHSQGKGDFLYGRAEVRAKIPAGRGSWSAIWMLPSDPYKYATKCAKNEDWQGNPNCDAWPNSGEIDIMEHVGYDMQNVHGTVHNKAYYWLNWEQRKSSVEGQNIDTEFHTYALEWTPKTITIFFDETPYFFYSNEETDWKSWPYDHPYHLILNLAIGGMWGRAGGPIDDSVFPLQMEIDYVRVFKKQNKNNIEKI
ncbi:family 16 glycosylhydrolase [Thalassotalea psychrophila]|uniref:Family 16 glycosylhydrolase n=1 Tax=Thalassotalea psychrophila TaxID=3065647 RepID=A0ABY9TSL5_9GAMM|nr:family 16 glycosylhydrolase [Colwelliaceae bacterium SQ149]